MALLDIERFAGYLGGLLSFGPRSGIALYDSTAVSADYPNVEILGVTDTTAPRTITLQSAQIAVVGFLFEINDESGGANVQNITIDTEGAQTIDGVASVNITENFGGVRFYTNGSNVFSRT
ncbi:MAG: hypothetical protein V3W41_14405 [Planctomycetota bacterium]